MYKPEQVLSVPDDLEAGPMDLYLSAAELQPTESLPLEFSDDLDVVGDGMPCPPSPLLFDPSLTLEDHSVTESAGDAGQMQAAGDGCRSQGARSVEKAAFPQRGLATANGKPEPTSIS